MASSGNPGGEASERDGIEQHHRHVSGGRVVVSTEALCIVCMEAAEMDSGVCCARGHFICTSDLSQYLAENVFPQVFKLRSSQCCVICPEDSCGANYSPIHLYEKMAKRERARFLAILTDVTLKNSEQLATLQKTIIDTMTLRCPTCRQPVDPFPDACSAIMCLNCGAHYCNYCFAAFASGNSDRDRAAAHEHAATHNTNQSPEFRDAFLPNALVVGGQRLYLSSLLVSTLTTTLTDSVVSAAAAAAAAAAASGDSEPDSSSTIGSRHLVELALVLCYQELKDLHISIIDLWEAINNNLASQGSQSSSSSSSSLVVSAAAGFGARVDAIQRGQMLAGGVALPPVPPAVAKQGGRQIANAILTDNSLAISQILLTIRGDQLDVDYVDTRHGHPLATLAILAGQPAVAEQLIRRRANPLLHNTGGRNVLYIATEAGSASVVRAILEMHPEINLNAPATTETQRYLPMHVAARYNHGHLVSILANHGASLDPEEGEHGYTPLTLALVLGHECAAAELIKLGSDLRMRALNGRTPMFVAAEKGLSEMINLVFERTDFDLNESVVSPSGLRLLHVAAFHQKCYVVTQLISLGANVDELDEEGGYSPLSMAIIGNCPTAALELIKAGANVNQASNTGRTPLYVAIEKGMTEVVTKLIVECGISVNAPTAMESSGSKPLHLALLHSQSHLLPVLLSLGADINSTDSEKNCTPLLMAAILEDEWSVRLLLDAGADVTKCTTEGRTAMYISAEKHNTTIMLLLASQQGIDIDAPCTNERGESSPLHVAATFNNAHAVWRLLERGADMNKLDARGKKPIDLARETSSFAAEETLLQHQREIDAQREIETTIEAAAVATAAAIAAAAAAEAAQATGSPGRRKL